MAIRHLLSAGLVMACLADCASVPPVGSPTQSTDDQSPNVYPTMKRWVGSLNPTRSYNASAVATERQNAYGRVELTVSPASVTLTHVALKVSVPNQPGLDMAGWAVAEGRCGSGNPPVLSPSAFQPIPLNANGQGSIDVTIPFVIPDKSIFHVSVFRGSGTQLTNVLSCADLRQES